MIDPRFDPDAEEEPRSPDYAYTPTVSGETTAAGHHTYGRATAPPEDRVQRDFPDEPPPGWADPEF